MANETCTYIFGAEYCESPLAESMKVVLLGLAALVAISLIVSGISLDASGLTGTEFYDGTQYLIQ